MGEKQLITATEVADTMKCSVSYVYKLVRANSLRHIRLGTDLRFDREDVLQFINSRKQGGVQDGR